MLVDPAVAGVGLMSMPLPAAAIAASGAGGDALVLESGSGWSLATLNVQSSASGPTKTEAAIGVVNSTPTNGTAVVRFYFLDGSTYLLIGETASFTVFGNDDYMAVALSMDFTFVAGTYAARLFLNGSTATYVDMKSANFAPV